jgi:hypothetical protein
MALTPLDIGDEADAAGILFAHGVEEARAHSRRDTPARLANRATALGQSSDWQECEASARHLIVTHFVQSVELFCEGRRTARSGAALPRGFFLVCACANIARFERS